METHLTFLPRNCGSNLPLRLFMRPALATIVVVFGAASAAAQPAPASATGASDHAAHGSSRSDMPTPLAFRSVFERYQSFRDEKVGSWRDANDTVTGVGGWREYLKEAQRPDTAKTSTPDAPSKPAAAPSPKVDPHAGHGAKK
jgi:hypothetical protein